jgi:hypothetical protein
MAVLIEQQDDLVRRARAMWARASARKRAVMCGSCALAAVMMISSMAYYGYDIPGLGLSYSHVA